MASTLTCNLCGKKFDPIDDLRGINLTVSLGAGSRFEGCLFDADFCCKCVDRIVATLMVNCAISPMSDVLSQSDLQELEHPEDL